MSEIIVRTICTNDQASYEGRMATMLNNDWVIISTNTIINQHGVIYWTAVMQKKAEV